MDDILVRVQVLLERANRERVEIPSSILDEFAQACRDSLEKEFSGPAERFTIRMSNIGRPLCQLQQEAAGTAKEGTSYNHRMNMLTGDLIEAAAIAIMKTAGVNIQSQHKKVSLAIAGTKLEGTYDVEIDGAIFDIKSASDYSFSNKFSGGYRSVANNDDFGYVAQGFGYAEAAKRSFGGWIVVNKENGLWCVTHAPQGQEYKDERTKALQKIESNVSAIKKNAAFVRCFEDTKETYYSRETGNRVLDRTCSWCSYKSVCWPDLIVKPQLNSKAKNPKLMDYTYIKGNE